MVRVYWVSVVGFRFNGWRSPWVPVRATAIPVHWGFGPKNLKKKSNLYVNQVGVYQELTLDSGGFLSTEFDELSQLLFDAVRFLFKAGLSRPCLGTSLSLRVGGLFSISLSSFWLFKLLLLSDRPLICKLSAVFKKAGKRFWDTFTSPLYMKSSRAFTSFGLTSFRKTIGCLLAVCMKRASKYGEHADRTIWWAWNSADQCYAPLLVKSVAVTTKWWFIKGVPKVTFD